MSRTSSVREMGWIQDMFTGAVDDNPNVAGIAIVDGALLPQTANAVLWDSNKSLIVKRILLRIGLAMLGSGANIAYKMLVTLLLRRENQTAFDPNYSAASDQRSDIMYQESRMVVAGLTNVVLPEGLWEIDCPSARAIGASDQVIFNIGVWAMNGTAPAAGAALTYNVHYRCLIVAP